MLFSFCQKNEFVNLFLHVRKSKEHRVEKHKSPSPMPMHCRRVLPWIKTGKDLERKTSWNLHEIWNPTVFLKSEYGRAGDSWAVYRESKINQLIKINQALDCVPFDEPPGLRWFRSTADRYRYQLENFILRFCCRSRNSLPFLSISTMGDYANIQKQTTIDSLAQELQNLMQTAPSEKAEIFKKEALGFQQLFSRFLLETGSAIQWGKIEPLPSSAVIDYNDLKSVSDSNALSAMLNKLVVVKLNGGLGTSMGCTGWIL